MYINLIILILIIGIYLICINYKKKTKNCDYDKYKHKLIKNTKNNIVNNSSNIELARFYHEKEIPYLALEYYKKCLLNKNYYVMLDIGDIYLFGLGSLDPNYYKAHIYYTNFLKINNTDEKHKSYAIERINQLYEILNNDTNGCINSLDKNKIISNIDDYLVDIITEEDLENTVEIIDNEEIVRDREEVIHFNDTINYNDIANNVLNYDNIPINNGIDYDNIYYDIVNDPQNSHDSGIQKTIKSSIYKLEKDTNIEYKYSELKMMFINDIKDMNISDKKLRNIKKIFNKIETDTTKSYNNKKTLKDVFTLVGNRIYTSNDEIYKKNAINNLMIELNDSVDSNNNPVCFTGVYNRIIDSLNLIDEDVVVKNKDILDQEILNKCSKIRNDFEKEVNVDNPEYSTLLKNKIMVELDITYVKTNILTKEELYDNTKNWIDFI